MSRAAAEQHERAAKLIERAADLVREAAAVLDGTGWADQLADGGARMRELAREVRDYDPTGD